MQQHAAHNRVQTNNHRTHTENQHFQKMTAFTFVCNRKEVQQHAAHNREQANNHRTHTENQHFQKMTAFTFVCNRKEVQQHAAHNREQATIIELTQKTSIFKK